MSPESAANRDKFFALIARFGELHRLLPADINDIDPDDIETMAGVRLILDEQIKTQVAMDQVLLDERKRRELAGEPWP
jgi:hypothetical protein